MSASLPLFLISEYATSCRGQEMALLRCRRAGEGGNPPTDLEGERRDALPHAEGSPQRPLGVLLTHFGGEVGNTAGSKQEEDEGVLATSCPEA